MGRLVILVTITESDDEAIRVLDKLSYEANMEDYICHIAFGDLTAEVPVV